ncbi:putative GGDEF family protein [Vibrio nigripulchritudo SFn27]|uniref:diguanylate cyclase n=1 Tax=Vibrio nigripulchritudo TaxID=28173 RepID=U4KHR3_9VIBR|nr:sensor domain-containing diguanylate cyclase [Vibrio nigripulchritudo]CCN68733.1 putative GGDEF family protein [Vibrio nigripulchritudo SFn118]CCN82980.1 putative GGDEF family protein [Vibrio nigripulchritudo BLFn1]CCN90752.1 putative GGDEF family protein [Vibrio nigripulchritudo SFn27]CCN97339.1 putative GGDEF family protein [Vibrio nigripulchritudo ENn2]CCO39975.1 putative GGDEF family protein [Vibrio nigripulchritudo SFn135]
MSKLTLYPIVLIMVFLALGLSHFHYQAEKIRQTTLSTLEVRSNLLRLYVRLMSAKNTAMKNSIELDVQQKSILKARADLIKEITYYPEFNTYALSAFDQPELGDWLKGTLTMDVPLQSANDPISEEIAAVLSINEQAGTVIDDLKMTVWAYYLSKNRFLFLSPKLPVETFQFSDILYEKPFWTELLPEKNPDRKQVVTELYDDAAGQGLMITISDAVYRGDEFLGIVAIDIGLDLMTSLLKVGAAPGESYLIDENMQLTASLSPFALGDKLPILVSDTGENWKESDEGWFYCTPTINKELFLVHRLKKTTLLLEAMKASSTVWSLLMIGCVLSILSFFTYVSAKKNRQLMLVDPLTGLYNRRGFYSFIQPIFQQSLRNQQKCGLLVIDIDHFKKINDSFGHNVGDEVIRSIAADIRRVASQSSVACRWGGEEFVILLQDTTLDRAHWVAEKIHLAIAKSKHGSKSLTVTVSIGLTVSSADIKVDEMMKKADIALYEAKEAGRNQTVIG